MSSRLCWIFVIAVAAISLGLMYFAPDSPGHAGAGSLGNAGLLVSLWTGLYLWSRQSGSVRPQAAPGEHQALIGLCAIGLMALYFCWTLYRVGTAVDLHEAEAQVMTRGNSMIGIAWLVLAAIQRRRESGILEDERDHAIRASACRAAHTVLVLALIGVIVLLGLLSHAHSAAPTPLLIAHGLIGLLILSGLVQDATALALYRRDRA